MMQKIKAFIAFIKDAKKREIYEPTYKVRTITKVDENEFIINVQAINKNLFFDAKPEEILSDDGLVDLFSPRDIRSITYLGYLCASAPEYKVLAKKVMEDTDEVHFVIKTKSDKKTITKAAQEIIQEPSIMNNVSPQDATSISYAAARDLDAATKREINKHNKEK